MNIFVLDFDPAVCAKFHCDKHVVKMVLESAQLLCNCHEGDDVPYKRTHYNHPCSVWARFSMDNYLWLLNLLEELLNNYQYRFGDDKKKVHKTWKVLEWLKNNQPSLPNKGLTPFAQAMPDQYKNEDVVKAYKDYYRNEKKDLLKYTKVSIPSWLNT